MSISSTEEIVAELRAGRMVILVDEEDRENEGDLVLAADFVTPDLFRGPPLSRALRRLDENHGGCRNKSGMTGAVCRAVREQVAAAVRRAGAYAPISSRPISIRRISLVPAPIS